MIMLVTNDISHIFNMLLTYLTRRGLKVVVIHCDIFWWDLHKRLDDEDLFSSKAHRRFSVEVPTFQSVTARS